MRTIYFMASCFLTTKYVEHMMYDYIIKLNIRNASKNAIAGQVQMQAIISYSQRLTAWYIPAASTNMNMLQECATTWISLTREMRRIYNTQIVHNSQFHQWLVGWLVGCVKNQLSHEWPTCHNRMAQHQGPWVSLEYTVKTVRISNTWSNTEFYMVAEP